MVGAAVLEKHSQLFENHSLLIEELFMLKGPIYVTLIGLQ